LAHLYCDVVGIDPDPGMIAEARNLAVARQIKNVAFIEMTAEELSIETGTFDTITFGGSFHWMDRRRVAGAVRSMLDAEGAVVQIDTSREPLPAQRLPHPLPPRSAIKELISRYLGPERRAGTTTGFESPTHEDVVWRGAGFTGPQTVLVPDGRILDRTAEDVVAGTLSMSSSTPYLFGHQLDDFLHDLMRLLTEHSPTGMFSLPLPDTELRIWRPTN
jgi:SAM-dependent methyltransferase